MYQIVRKLVDDVEQYNGENAPKLTVTLVYEKIKRSNSSLNRKSKKLLEDSIERVLESIEEETRSSDGMGSIDGEFDGIEISEPRATNDMNKSLVGMWTKPAASQDVREVGGKIPAESKKRSLNGDLPAKKKKAKVDHSPPTHISLRDIGGVDSVIEELEDMIVLALRQPKLYLNSRIKPTRGILLRGPPGCGKTMIVNAVAATLGVPFISISAPSVVSGMSGESEKALRGHFEQAVKFAPALLFIDEIDAIAPKREGTQREMEKRIVAQLLTCFDDLALEKTGGKPVIVLAATNRPDSLDPALRRGGRFDREISLNIPSEAAREQILQVLTTGMSIAGDIDLKRLAKQTAGFVGADLSNLVSTAGSAAIRRFRDTLKAEAQMDVDSKESRAVEFERLDKLVSDPSVEYSQAIHLQNEDFTMAFSKTQATLKREGFTTIPDTTWEHIGALAHVRKQLVRAIVDPIRVPERYARVGITAPTGVLLWGPPGCGKTLLAKAVANESRANFISVNGPELLNKYVGESERAVRQVFSRARSCVPCVIFMDEIDAMVPKRDDALSESKAGVVNTLLTELDGLGDRRGIYVIGATNRPDRIDPAMLRPGRLETLLYVGLPETEERVEILKTLTRDMPVEFDETMASVARSCEGLSGADLGSLASQAGYIAFDRDDYLTPSDFVEARKLAKPSVRDIERYERLKARGL